VFVQAGGVEMRRAVILVLGLLATLAVVAPPAFATFHLEMVNEVMLASSSGDSNVQFVELLDHGGTEEAFTPVFAPYKLVIYDAAGNKKSEHTLDPAGLRAAAMADREYLLSTPAADGALGVMGDEKLDVQLPLAAGQACFEGNPGAFSCLTWGTITKAVTTNSMGTGSVHGPKPPNGQSDQRQPNHSVVAAAPTPKAPNKAGPAKRSFKGVGFGKKRIKVDGAGRAPVLLKCPKKSGGCSGRLGLTSAGRKPKGLGSATFSIAQGHDKRVLVKLNAAARKRLANAGTLKAHAVARAHDSAGHDKRTTADLVLVAPSAGKK
jgi:hypothetical protein